MTTIKLIQEHLDISDKQVEQISKLMIEFADHHVRKALLNAWVNSKIYNKSKFDGDVNPEVDYDSIADAYPKSNII